MTRTSQIPDAARPTRRERAIVLGGFAVASLWTAVSAAFGAGMETAVMLWLAAVGWAVLASLVCALQRGLRDGDWSAFRRCELPENNDALDWSLKSGAYVDMAVAEEHERLMRGD
ncbi:MAG: hypothetical protein OXC15_13870 [Rhodospirillaceae bacterium]|nr:hypothetical protein [Rhodospirillaceae bacterium]